MGFSGPFIVFAVQKLHGSWGYTTILLLLVLQYYY